MRFDLNDYSLPHTCVRRTVTVSASLDTVRVLDAGAEVARHRRTYARGEQIENPAHLAALASVKRQARYHRGQDRLAKAAPSSVAFLTLAAERGHRLAGVVGELERLLARYRHTELEAAFVEALARDVCHPAAVQQVLEQRREKRCEPSPLAIVLPDNEQARQLVVRPASLAAYDALNHPDTVENDDEQPC